MSLEELWNLFPITFVPHEEYFKKYYLEEEEILRKIIGKYIIRISHIGSTAINNIKTKPIVDILIEIDFLNKDIVKEILKRNNYFLMNEENDKISFNKGYTVNGYSDKVYHIHIKKIGDNSELYFRDYLNEYEDVRMEYEKLKLELYEKYKPNRNLYTLYKSDFVNDIVKKAKIKYRDEYN